MIDKRRNIVEHIESISEQIQILALNIAVAAAKMSSGQRLTPDVNSKLSQLVNQATLAVKNMDMVIRAAKSEKPKQNLISANIGSIDAEVVDGIETSLKAILDDSQKIMEMLNEVKPKSV